ncbi:MAG: ankyrin repeat domain-containing protein [Gammaproteobacteria bacterium]
MMKLENLKNLVNQISELSKKGYIDAAWSTHQFVSDLLFYYLKTNKQDNHPDLEVIKARLNFYYEKFIQHYQETDPIKVPLVSDDDLFETKNEWSEVDFFFGPMKVADLSNDSSFALMKNLKNDLQNAIFVNDEPNIKKIKLEIDKLEKLERSKLVGHLRNLRKAEKINDQVKKNEILSQIKKYESAFYFSVAEAYFHESLNKAAACIKVINGRVDFELAMNEVLDITAECVSNNVEMNNVRAVYHDEILDNIKKLHKLPANMDKLLDAYLALNRQLIKPEVGIHSPQLITDKIKLNTNRQGIFDKLCLLSTEEYLDVADILKENSQFFKEFLSHIIKDSLRYLGEPVCDFAVIALGSLARGDMSLYSDIELMIALTNNNPKSIAYFSDLVRLIDFKIACLGEQYTTSHIGFHLDNKTMLLEEKGSSVLNTVPKILDFHFAGLEKDFQSGEDQNVLLMRFSLLNTALVYSNNESLYTLWIEKRDHLLHKKNLRQQQSYFQMIGSDNISRNLHFYAYETRVRLEGSTNIKERFIRPLTSIILGLSHYNEIFDNDLKTIINHLKMKVVSSKFKDFISALFDSLLYCQYLRLINQKEADCLNDEVKVDARLSQIEKLIEIAFNELTPLISSYDTFHTPSADVSDLILSKDTRDRISKWQKQIRKFTLGEKLIHSKVEDSAVIKWLEVISDDRLPIKFQMSTEVLVPEVHNQLNSNQLSFIEYDGEKIGIIETEDSFIDQIASYFFCSIVFAFPVTPVTPAQIYLRGELKTVLLVHNKNNRLVNDNLPQPEMIDNMNSTVLSLLFIASLLFGRKMHRNDLVTEKIVKEGKFYNYLPVYLSDHLRLFTEDENDNYILSNILDGIYNTSDLIDANASAYILSLNVYALVKQWLLSLQMLEQVNVQQMVSRISNAGLKYQPLARDGHSLYRAVSLYSNLSVQELRNSAALYLEDNLNRYRSIIQAINPTQTPENCIAAIKNGNKCADNLEIAILMQVLNRPIVIIGPNGNIMNRADIQPYSGEPIFVYYNDHHHYDGLMLTNIEKPTGQSILESLIHWNEHPPETNFVKFFNSNQSFHFSLKTVEDVINRLRMIQEILLGESKLTYAELTNKWIVYLKESGQSISREKSSIADLLKYFNEKQDTDFYKHRNALLKGDLEHFNSVSPKDISSEDMKKLLRSIFFDTLRDPVQQNNVLSVLSYAEYSFEELNFKGCAVLDDALLIEIIDKSPNLISLNLSGCKNIEKFETITYLANKCLSLKELDLSYTKFEKFGHFGFSNILWKNQLTFPQLSKLILSNCTELQAIKFTAVNLRELDVSECQKLSLIEVESERIFLKSEYNKKLDIELLKKWIEKTPAISSLKINGCENIQFNGTKILEHYPAILRLNANQFEAFCNAYQALNTKYLNQYNLEGDFEDYIKPEERDFCFARIREYVTQYANWSRYKVKVIEDLKKVILDPTQPEEITLKAAEIIKDMNFDLENIAQTILNSLKETKEKTTRSAYLKIALNNMRIIENLASEIHDIATKVKGTSISDFEFKYNLFISLVQQMGQISETALISIQCSSLAILESVERDIQFLPLLDDLIDILSNVSADEVTMKQYLINLFEKLLTREAQKSSEIKLINNIKIKLVSLLASPKIGKKILSDHECQLLDNYISLVLESNKIKSLEYKFALANKILLGDTTEIQRFWNIDAEDEMLKLKLIEVALHLYTQDAKHQNAIRILIRFSQDPSEKVSINAINGLIQLNIINEVISIIESSGKQKVLLEILENAALNNKEIFERMYDNLDPAKLTPIQWPLVGSMLSLVESYRSKTDEIDDYEYKYQKFADILKKLFDEPAMSSMNKKMLIESCARSKRFLFENADFIAHYLSHSESDVRKAALNALANTPKINSGRVINQLLETGFIGKAVKTKLVSGTDYKKSMVNKCAPAIINIQGERTKEILKKIASELGEVGLEYPNKSILNKIFLLGFVFNHQFINVLSAYQASDSEITAFEKQMFEFSKKFRKKGKLFSEIVVLTILANMKQENIEKAVYLLGKLVSSKNNSICSNALKVVEQNYSFESLFRHIELCYSQCDIDIRRRTPLSDLQTIYNLAISGEYVQLAQALTHVPFGQISKPIRNNLTVLQCVVFTGDLRAVEALCSKASEDDINKAFYLSALYGKENIFCYFKDNIHNLNLMYQDLETKSTVLHAAVSQAHIMLVNIILAITIERAPNLLFMRDINGNTPLHLAAIEGNDIIIQEILNARDKIKTHPDKVELCREKNNNDQNAFHLALVNGNQAAFDKLKKSYSEKEFSQKILNFQDKNNDSFAHLAVKNDLQSMLESLCQLEINLSLKNNLRQTALDIAVDQNRESLVKLLITHLEKNEIIKQSSSETMSPLSLSIYKGYENIVKVLLDGCFDIDTLTKNSDEITPLGIAAQRGYLSIVKFLVEEKGADVNAGGRRALLPIFLAASQGHLDVVAYLLGKKADVSSPEKSKLFSSVEDIPDDLELRACNSARKMVENALSEYEQAKKRSIFSKSGDAVPKRRRVRIENLRTRLKLSHSVAQVDLALSEVTGAIQAKAEYSQLTGSQGSKLFKNLNCAHQDIESANRVVDIFLAPKNRKI